MENRLAKKEKLQFMQVQKWLRRLPELSSNSKIVYSVIYELLDESVGYSYPGLNYIAKETGLTNRQVTYSIAELVKKLFIEASNNAGKSNHYYILRKEEMGKTPHTVVRGDPPQICRDTPHTVVGTPPTNLSGVSYIYNINNNRRENKGPSAPSPVLLIFDYWKSKIGGEHSTIDQGRKDAIEKALLAYDEAVLKLAIDGCAKSEWHMDNGHNGVEYIFSKADNIEKFSALVNSTSNPDSDISVRAKIEMGNVLAKRPSSVAAKSAFRLACDEFGSTHDFRYCSDEKKALKVFTKHYAKEQAKDEVGK